MSMITGGVACIRTIDGVDKSSRRQILFIWDQFTEVNIIHIYSPSTLTHIKLVFDVMFDVFELSQNIRKGWAYSSGRWEKLA